MLIAPTAVPPEARSRLSQILNTITTTADYGEFYKRFGLESPAQTQAFMNAELEHASVIARKAGIKFEQ